MKKLLIIYFVLISLNSFNQSYKDSVSYNPAWGEPDCHPVYKGKRYIHYNIDSEKEHNKTIPNADIFFGIEPKPYHIDKDAVDYNEKGYAKTFIGFTPLDTNNMSYGGKLTKSCGSYNQKQFDTISVYLLVCNIKRVYSISHYIEDIDEHTGKIMSDTVYYDYDYSVFWTFGYKIIDFNDNIRYLDKNKQEFPDNIIIWQTIKRKK